MVIFEKVALTNEIKQLLSTAMASDPLNTISSIEEEVKKGVCHIVGGYNVDVLVLVFAFRIDVAEAGKELVVVAGASKGHGNTKLSIPVFEKLAKQFDCDYIRIHTSLKALAKILIQQGFFLSELVVRKRVK